MQINITCCGKEYGMDSYDREALSLYLERHGIAPRGEVSSIEEIREGVSAEVYRVKLASGDIIVKRPLEKLKVEQEWISDTIRGKNEFKALSITSSLLGDGTVPEPYFYDDERRTLVMSAAPERFVTWKSLLMRKETDSRIAGLLADSLALLHLRSMGAESFDTELNDSSRLFYELRLGPYFESLLPLYRGERDRLLEVMGLLGERRISLVHGDFSPKNILTDGSSRIVILDWEVIHYGNPVFDVGFMCNHLTLKTIHLGENNTRKWADLIRLFYSRYQSAASDLHMSEEDFFKVLGALLLARVDGKSPVEYLSREEKDFVRKFGLHVLNSKFDSIGDYCSDLEARLRHE